MFKLNSMFFSPTSTTGRVIGVIEKGLMGCSGICRGVSVDFTLPSNRKEVLCFGDDDILLIGLPVYAGRVPNVLLDYLKTFRGDNSLAIPVVVYGNRDYDDALIELNDILETNGFNVIAGGAFVGEHSFSNILAMNRPDDKDLSIARDFADMISKKISEKDFAKIEVKGNRPYRPYYMPKNENDKPVDIRKVSPKTNDNCIDCKLCSEVCPMGSIPYDEVRALVGICIKCCACVKFCPTGAKFFDDADYIRHKRELEEQCVVRREPEVFVI